jgi:DNA polymerase-3 subunit alpha
VDPRFVHLHLHSEYSLVDGLVRVEPLVQSVAALGMPAVAVTDQCNLFALVRFYRAAVSAGLKPIAGADLWVRNPDDANSPDRLVLLVQDALGYRNLTRLISRAYVEGQHLGLPMVERAWVEASAAGLIALSGGPEGDVARCLLKGQVAAAEDRLDAWLAAFGDRYYLELVRTGREQEGEVVEASVDLAIRKGVPVVATNDVRFLDAEDFEAHEVRVCIHQGRTLDDPRRPRRYSAEQRLRSPDEMAELFADLPEALENSVEIAKRCNLELALGKSFLPDFPVPPGMTVDAHFAATSRTGLEARLDSILAASDTDLEARRAVYVDRLEGELGVITQMGFPGYFLIVADFIQWAKSQGIPVGPGRGSGAGSLVAYALGITDLDPIEHDLLFERFLNPERVSMPDFDVDFCMEGRDRVIEYVAETYGRDAVSQIITFGTMAAKAVVRDVGRVMGHPYGFVDKVAKMVPFELKMTLEKALAESDDLRDAYETDEEIRALIDMARKLEGLTRNAGKHAGGVVIAPTVLTDFAPLYCEPGGENLVTQFDKDDVEQVGLVKFDFLGLRTLTIIDWALNTINAERRTAGEPPIDITRIDPRDEAAFALLKRCETTAVFQLESRGMKELIKKLQPDSFGDITALVALFRPGPLQSGMVDDFIDRKHGRAEVAYPHPALEPILKPTYGIILYQEQVMQIAQVLAG